MHGDAVNSWDLTENDVRRALHDAARMHDEDLSGTVLSHQQRIRNRKLDPRRSGDEDRWVFEASDAALRRTADFGRPLLDQLLARHPDLRRDMVALRFAGQPRDTFVIFDRICNGFAVQIDTSLEYVVVWGPDCNAEFGDWVADRIGSALDFIETRFLK